MTAKLVVRGLSKVYEAPDRSIPALSNIDLTLEEGEFVSVIGPNASGKSTLLKIIAGVLAPTSGVVELNGIVAPQGHFHFSKPEYRQEKLVAYMPQDHGLLPWRTVLENLYLPNDIEGIVRRDVHKKIIDLLAEFGLEEYVHAYPATLSGGTRQKIALLRTVLQDISLLLLDEPFASLDALTRLEAQTWLHSLLEKRKVSVLLVTHDIREAIFFSDTIHVLSSRPGEIKETFTVPFPRLRRHDVLRMPEALELEKKLFSLLVPTV